MALLGSSCRVLGQLLRKDFIQCVGGFNYRRFSSRYLSPEYDCQSAWDKRLESNLIAKINLDDFFLDMEKKFVTEKFISAIDVDLFVNKVTAEDNLEEVEELTHRLRKTRATTYTLPSTSFAVIRLFLKFNKTDELMRILEDRINYGVFPEYYTSNLLMDTFLNRNNFKDAARIACLHMMQEDFGPTTTQLFALLSCLKHLEEGIPESWEPIAEPVQVSDAPKGPTRKEKKPEEEKVRVLYQRNVYFDDHFDLTKPRHLVGKTFAYLSQQFREDDVLKRSTELLGWAMFDKWDKVEENLKGLVEKRLTVSAETIQRVNDLLSARLIEIEGSADKTFPKPKLRAIPGWNLDPKEVDDCFARLKWDEPSKYLQPVKELLNGNKILTVDLNLVKRAEELLEQAVAANQQKEIEAQIKIFEEWETLRINELDRQLARIREEQTLYEIERKKRELREKEDTIFFFDNEQKWMMQQPEDVPPIDPKLPQNTGKSKSAKIEDDSNYIPPQVKAGRQS